MLCLLMVLSSFFEELLGSLGYCFLRRVYFVCGGACLLSSKSCSTCRVICFWLLRRFTLLVGLLGLLRGGLLSLAFSVSINKLKIYE